MPAPGTPQEAARVLAAGRPVRIAGAGTRPWGPPVRAEVELSTAGLTGIVEHNAGDLTAVLRAGTPLDDARRAFAERGQMLALDPPGGGTIGGLFATADSGPLRHRYGAPRDLIVGITVCLSDGTVAKAGGKVIKNVAGYDLAKLFTGAHGTLGLIAQVAVRLHPLPGPTATAVARADDPAVLAQAALAAAGRPLEADCLDVAWAEGAGELLARFSGRSAAERARAAAGALPVDAEVLEDDEDRWARQREGQRGKLVVRVAHLPSELPALLRVVDAEAAALVGRAALGLSWVRVPAPDAGAVDRLRARGFACTLLDAPETVRATADVWGPIPAAPLMRRVRERFDPAASCNPGALVR